MFHRWWLVKMLLIALPAGVAVYAGLFQDALSPIYTQMFPKVNIELTSVPIFFEPPLPFVRSKKEPTFTILWKGVFRIKNTDSTEISITNIRLNSIHSIGEKMQSETHPSVELFDNMDDIVKPSKNQVEPIPSVSRYPIYLKANESKIIKVTFLIEQKSNSTALYTCDEKSYQNIANFFGATLGTASQPAEFQLQLIIQRPNTEFVSSFSFTEKAFPLLGQENALGSVMHHCQFEAGESIGFSQDPNYPTTMYLNAPVTQERGKMLESLKLKELELHVALYERDTTATVLLARRFMNDGQLERARKTLSSFSEQGQEAFFISVLRNNLGVISMEKREYERAIYHLRTAIDAKPCAIGAVPYQNILGIHKFKKNYIKAFEIVIEYISECEDYREQWLHNIDEIGIDSGDFSSALKAYAIVKEKGLRNGDLYYYIAVTNLRLGEQKEVLKNLQMAVSLGTKYRKEALNNQISILVWENKIEDAKEIAKTITKEYPKYFYGPYNLAWIYMLQNNLNKAVKYYKVALELDKNHVRAHCEIAELYNKIGQQKNASIHTSRVKELEQNCSYL